MKHGFIKVAAATPRVTVADCKANGEEILKAIHEMEKEHVKLMVFPEFCITGYTCHDLFLQRCLLDSAWDELLHIAEETRETDALIFVGLPLRHRGKLYNVAAALNHGRIVGFVPKTHIPNYNEFYEQRQFAGAEEEDVEFVDFLKCEKNEEDEFWDEIPFGTELIFECKEFPEFTVAAELCEDLWVPAPPSIRHAVNGAHIIVNLSASDEMVGKDSYRRTLISGQSARLICGYPSKSRTRTISPFTKLPMMLAISLSYTQRPPDFRNLPSPFFNVTTARLINSTFSLSRFPVTVCDV